MHSLYAYASKHHGILTDQKALELGLTTRQISLRIANGQLVRIAPRVLMLGGVPKTWKSKMRALVLSTNGLASHRSAAFLHGIDGYTDNVTEVTVPKSRRPRAADGRIHRTTQFGLAREIEIDGIATTAPSRTVIDLAAVVSFRRLEWTVDAVLRQRLCTWTDLVSTLACHSVQGRNGCGPLRALLEQRSPADPIPDSAWNRMVGQLLDSSGLPTPDFEYVIADAAGRFIARVDLAYPNERLAIELDSVRWHLNRDSFENDPRRKNKLINAGWTVLTFTWSDYAARPSELVNTIRNARQAAAQIADSVVQNRQVM